MMQFLFFYEINVEEFVFEILKDYKN